MTGRRSQPPPPGRGYALVALVVIVAVMNVLVAASLPYWSKVIQRDKEAELIFRGLQYAEGIRVFQQRFNRLPNTLDELIEVNPRSIRRLWKDPMTEEGEWQTIRARVGGGSGRDVARGTAPGDGRQRQEDRQTTDRRQEVGPIIGVRSRSEESGMREFMGSDSYAQWRFTIEVVPVPGVLPDSQLVPRPTSDWIGRPFRDGLEPRQGRGPERQRQGGAERE